MNAEEIMEECAGGLIPKKEDVEMPEEFSYEEDMIINWLEFSLQTAYLRQEREAGRKPIIPSSLPMFSIHDWLPQSVISYDRPNKEIRICWIIARRRGPDGTRAFKNLLSYIDSIGYKPVGIDPSDAMKRYLHRLGFRPTDEEQRVWRKPDGQ